MKEQPTEVSRGWYFPTCLVQLYESGLINAEQMMLLGKINALQDAKRGCYASNKWLGEWWKKHPTWVSNTISILAELGLLKVSLVTKNGRTERRIKVTYQGDDIRLKLKGGYKKSLSRVRQKSKGGLDKSLTEYYDDDTYVSSSNKKETDAAHAAYGSFGLNGDSNTPSGKLCRKFHEFLITNRLHLGRKKPNLRKWKESCDILIQQVQGNLTRIKEVMKWYFQNFRNQFVPTCHSFITFCERFFGIEKSMFRITGEDAPKPEKIIQTFLPKRIVR